MTVSPNSSPETDSDVEVIEIEACCQACAKTFEMVLQMHGLVDGLMNSPIAQMALPNNGGAGNRLPSGFILPSQRG